VTDILDGEQRGGLTRGNRESGDSPFECGHALFEHGLRRVHDARVNVAELFEREKIAGMFGRIELIGRGLVDRHRNGRSGRIGPIPGMQYYGFCVWAGRRHEFLPPWAYDDIIVAVQTSAGKDDHSMSALGQKQTYAAQQPMSALPPKVTSNATYGDVRFGPKADISFVQSSPPLSS